MRRCEDEKTLCVDVQMRRREEDKVMGADVNMRRFYVYSGDEKM